MTYLLLGLLVILVELRRRQTLAQIERETLALPSLRDRVELAGLAERARCLAGASSSILATVRRGKLVFRDFAKVDAARIRERERRVRRGPFASATPIWHETFLDDGTFTLVVPLIARGRTLGYWLPSFASANAPTDMIAALAVLLANALDERRERSSAMTTLRRAHADHEDLARLCEAMPYGVFVMSVWGQVRYANTAMKLACAIRCVELDRDPVALLGGLTGHDDALGQLRRFIESQAPLCMVGEGGSVALSWLNNEEERLVVGWVLPDERVESPALLSSMSLTMISPIPSGTLRFDGVPA